MIASIKTVLLIICLFDMFQDECMPTDMSASASVDGAKRLDTAKITDEEALRLEEENRELKEAKKCRVCMDRETNTVFLPCGHLSCCEICAKSLSNCPICRNAIRGTVKTFLA